MKDQAVSNVYYNDEATLNPSRSRLSHLQTPTQRCTAPSFGGQSVSHTTLGSPVGTIPGPKTVQLPATPGQQPRLAFSQASSRHIWSPKGSVCQAIAELDFAAGCARRSPWPGQIRARLCMARHFRRAMVAVYLDFGWSRSRTNSHAEPLD